MKPITKEEYEKIKEVTPTLALVEALHIYETILIAKKITTKAEIEELQKYMKTNAHKVLGKYITEKQLEDLRLALKIKGDLGFLFKTELGDDNG